MLYFTPGTYKVGDITLGKKKVSFQLYRCTNVLFTSLCIYRNYDSTASLESFFLQEGVGSLVIDGNQTNDISDIIDAGNEL